MGRGKLTACAVVVLKYIASTTFNRNLTGIFMVLLQQLWVELNKFYNRDKTGKLFLGNITVTMNALHTVRKSPSICFTTKRL